jgi:spectinomycin phosphotransferase
MGSRLDRVAESVIVDVVADRWALEIDALDYFPEGGGAYHWIAFADDAPRWFLTCDDLDTKPWLGADRDSVFDGLAAAYDTARILRNEGLAFVIAPLAAISGASAERVDERHSVSVFDYIDGEPGHWGQAVRARARDDLVTMLARLHQTPTTGRLAHRGVDVPGRSYLEDALKELDRPWDGGPLSEPARRELATNAEQVVASLRELDRLAVGIGGSPSDVVVTHGEPHPGNLIHTRSGVVLVDWDTVALAPPERDLWMIADDDVASAYRELTGTSLDTEALAAYRLLWAVTDVAAFITQLRGEHRQNADAERALAALQSIFDKREPAPYGRMPG